MEISSMSPWYVADRTTPTPQEVSALSAYYAAMGVRIIGERLGACRLVVAQDTVARHVAGKGQTWWKEAPFRRLKGAPEDDPDQPIERCLADMPAREAFKALASSAERDRVRVFFDLTTAYPFVETDSWQAATSTKVGVSVRVAARRLGIPVEGEPWSPFIFTADLAGLRP